MRLERLEVLDVRVVSDLFGEDSDVLVEGV